MLNRNLFILSISQIFSFTSPTVTVLLSGIIGSKLINIQYLATFPTALMIVGSAIGAPFAAKVMEIKGRRFGFIFSSLLNSSASLICAYSLSISSFTLFCFGNLLIGLSVSFILQYRFAATELVHKDNIPRAISLILLLGIIAALLGTNIVSFTKDFFNIEFIGSYISLSLLTILPFFFFLFYDADNFLNKKIKNNKKSIIELLSNKHVQLAILSAGVGYITMSTLMTATPISMNIMHGYSIFSTGIVIQFHVIGMFLPSLFTGNLIKKYGHKNIILTGIFILFICIFINFNFVTYYGFLLGLILLGVGWNFLFVSGTSLLVISYDEDNKFLSQGLNDFVVFSSQAIGSLSAGLLLYLTSWKTLNLICLPLLLLLTYFILRNNFKIIQNN